MKNKKLRKQAAVYITILITVVLALYGSCTSDNDDDSENDTTLPELEIWTVGHTVRVLRDEPPGNQLAVHLAAARNEWETFQILLRSDSDIRGISVVPGDLSGPNGALISAATAFLYRAHQFYLDSPSWGVPDFTPGWYPDPLIPFQHPLTHEPLTDPTKLLAVPFDLPAHETHGFAVDLGPPADAVAGDYQGTYLVACQGQILAEIPVTLTVWDFALPEIPVLYTNFGAPEHQMRHLAWLEGKSYGEGYWTQVARQCNELVSRHGINPVLKGYAVYFEANELGADGSFGLSEYQLNTMQSFINAHSLNAIELPLRGTPSIKEVVFGSAGYSEDTFEETEFTSERRARLINYVRCWDNEISQLSGIDHILFYVYLCDEPNTSAAYDFVRSLGTAIKAAHLDRIKVLVVEQTTPDSPDWGNLYGAIDIWVPYFYAFDSSQAAERQALGEQIWTYTALSKYGGGLFWQTDYPLLNYRIPCWIAWQYDLTGLLYWSLAYWWGSAYPDIWNTPRTYADEWQGTTYYYNGDGVLVYPAEEVGYDGICPSLRLKAIRDGIEDFEYLVLAASLDRSDQAREIVQGVATSFRDYQTDPEAYEQARSQLAALIME